MSKIAMQCFENFGGECPKCFPPGCAPYTRSWQDPRVELSGWSIE